MSRKFPLQALIVVLLFLLGCSSSEEKPYRIAFDPSWYPQNFMGKEPAISGFSASLLQAIAEREDFHAELMAAGPAFLEWGLMQGQYDAILTSLSPAVNYEGRYLFSDTYLPIGPVIVVASNSGYKKLEDLGGRTIGVLRGSSIVSFLGATIPRVVILAYDSPAAALEALLGGQFDALAMPSITAHSFVLDLYSDRLKIITAPLNNEGLRLVTLTSHDALISSFNRGLKKIEHKDLYRDLLQQWRIN